MKYIKNFAVFSLLALFLSTAAYAEKKDVPAMLEGTQKVTAEEAIELIGSMDDLVVIDARKVSDHEKGWIEGSISLPNTETTPESLAKAAPSKSAPLLIYCNGVKCGRSYESAQKAMEYGYSKIYWFRGGMEEWEAKGLPVVKE